MSQNEKDGRGPSSAPVSGRNSPAQDKVYDTSIASDAAASFAARHGNEVNPYDNPGAGERIRRDTNEAAATEQRRKRWGRNRYGVSVLVDNPAPWARKLASAIERTDAFRDPAKKAPTLMFTGAEAVKVGATDPQLRQLSTMSDAEIAEVKMREAALIEDSRGQIKALSRSIATQRDTAVAAPVPLDLAELLALPDDPAAYRVGELWPIGGRVLLAAQYKAGKSTMVGNVIRALVDGGKFLGRFDVAPVGKVVLVDTELDTRTLRRWLREQGIVNVEAVTVLALRGAVSTFDITDRATRSQWAQQLAGADVVILDCLRPVLDALGLSEDKDSGRVLVAFDALLAEIGAAEGMVVTHMGHQNERARGDSRLLDWNDAMWKIVRTGDDSDDDASRPRFFSALGRDVSLPEGQLTFDTATRHLAYEDGSRKDSTARSAMPDLIALVRREPGTLSKADAERRLKEEHGIPQQSARAAIKMAIADNALSVDVGDHGKHLLSPGDPFTVAKP